MKKASEYRRHAEECRGLAKALPPGDQRTQLLEMARTWDNLAADRAALVLKHPDLAIGDEHREERAEAAGGPRKS